MERLLNCLQFVFFLVKLLAILASFRNSLAELL